LRLERDNHALTHAGIWLAMVRLVRRINESERDDMRAIGYIAAPVAAKLAKVSVSYVYRRVKAGLVGSRRVGGSWYVDARGWAMLWSALPDRVDSILRAVRTL
jgi:hypothetical protein